MKLLRLSAAIAAFALAAILGGVLAAQVARVAAPRSFDRYEASDGRERITAWSREEARERLAGRYARAHDGGPEMARARTELRARLRARISPEPLPPLTRAGECAARVTAFAGLLRSLAEAGPAPAPPTAETVAFDPAWREATAAAIAATDAAALDRAIAGELEELGHALERRAAELPAASRAGLWPAWRTALLARAVELESIAVPLLGSVPAWVAEGVPPRAAVRALALEPLVPDPSSALRRHRAEPDVVVVQPIRSFWESVVGLGALTGLVLAGFVTVLARSRARRAPESRRAGPVTSRSPALPDVEAPPLRLPPIASLQIVAAGSRASLSRAVCEIVAHPLARGRRVVVVDASRRLRLHEPLGLSDRLGFVECMTQGLPALGLVQGGGFTGLFLLSRGKRGRITDWLPLDRVLEELRPHFDYTVLAFEAEVPPVVGGVLAGRIMEGWWAGPGPAAARRGRRTAELLAITLSDIDLQTMPKASLEALEARLAALETTIPESERKPAPPPAPRISAPAVLDSDLQIRQKLRYLAWMRRMRTERERAETADRS